MGLLWEFFFVSLGSAEIPWVSGLLLVLVLPFCGPLLGLFGLCFGPGVRGVMALGGLGGQGFVTGFRCYVKIIHWNRGRYSFLIPASSVWTRTLVCLQ